MNATQHGNANSLSPFQHFFQDQVPTSLVARELRSIGFGSKR